MLVIMQSGVLQIYFSALETQQPKRLLECLAVVADEYRVVLAGRQRRVLPALRQLRDPALAVDVGAHRDLGGE